MFSAYFVSLISLLLNFTPTSTHPLCLDAEPPFSFTNSSNHLDFCSEYSSFGCCTRDDDQRIRAVYDDYVTNGTNSSSNCASYLKTLLCLECNPYAAHVFDAEGATSATSRKYFPGLCQTYCSELYRRCQEVIPYISNNERIRNAVAGGEQVFCNEARISDMTYCYPDIINNTNLNQEIDRQQSSEQGCLCLEPFASQLRNALLLVYPDDGTGRLFVGEQLGLVTIFYKNGTRLPNLFLDISNLVLTSSSPGDERGFLGMVFHPKFSTNQLFYVYFTIGQSGNFRTRVSEFKTMPGNPNRADVNSERVVLEINQPYSNHNGGQLLFGYDGYLYITVGDGGAGGDPSNYAQNLGVLLGKVLRIDVDKRTGDLQYGIPPSNPFVNNSQARGEIYAYGARNMWRCSFDRGDFKTGEGRGRLFCGDVGQARFEEVDIIKSGGNYGWRAREGFECYDSNMCGRIGPEEYPIYAYGRDLGQSITGGFVYRGCHYPSLNGLYIFGDYGSGRIFRLKSLANNQWENKEILMCQSRYCTNGLKSTYERNILSFGEDFDGDVYVLTTNNPSPTSFSGSIYRIVDPLRRNDPTVCSSTSSQTTRATPVPNTRSPSVPISVAPSITASSDFITTLSENDEFTDSTISTRGTVRRTSPPRSPTPNHGSASPQSIRALTSLSTEEFLTVTESIEASKTSKALPTMLFTTQLLPVTTNGSWTSNNGPIIWSCDFEDSAFGAAWCGIQQATDDQFDWSILSGPTPSDPTGPDAAYSGDLYIFIETSNPRKVNDTAKIYLPIPPNNVAPSGTFCLTFAYHMFGFHIREIRLIIENSSGGPRIIWSQRGQKGNFWLQAAVTLHIQPGERVAFVGIRGDEFSGDIGLDDIALRANSC